MSRIDDLKAKLAARTGQPGMKDNCDAIEAEIAKLETRRDAAEVAKRFPKK